jgi:hypothetical protein
MSVGQGFDRKGQRQGLDQRHGEKSPLLTTVTTAGSAQVRVARVVAIGMGSLLEGLEYLLQGVEGDLWCRQRAATSGDLKRPLLTYGQRVQ